jgi:hypothetical protein
VVVAQAALVENMDTASQSLNGWTALLPDEDYRFHFGLKPGDAAQFFAPTASQTELLRERNHWLSEQPHLHATLLPEGEPLLRETIQLARQWGQLPPEFTEPANPFASLVALGRVWEADFLLLKRGETEGIRLFGGCVCFPSSWTLTEKTGHRLEEIHEPVPTLNADLGARIDSFLTRMKPGTAWCRANWGLSRSAELNYHPERKLPRLTPPLREDEAWLRIENQVLTPLAAGAGILFGIRLEVHSLMEIKASPTALRGLRRALQTMPEEIAVYKGLAQAREALLALL